jgi:catechol 2,3-dioxygenase-like lactoylglutathione lyase family enzyme
VLGFDEMQRPSTFDFPGHWLFAYGIAIHLIEGTPVNAKHAEITVTADHISFHSSSMEQVKERLQDHGIQYVEDQFYDGPLVIHQIFFHDPNHNMIEVCNCADYPLRAVG